MQYASHFAAYVEKDQYLCCYLVLNIHNVQYIDSKAHLEQYFPSLNPIESLFQ